MHSRYAGHVLVFLCFMSLLFFFLPNIQSWASRSETDENSNPPNIFPASDQSSLEPHKPSLASLFNKYGSDKERSHGYSRYYGPILEPLRNQPIRLVEIGVANGKSMSAWMEYFSNPGYIYGIGYRNTIVKDEGVTDCSGLKMSATTGGCSLFFGDQSNLTFLEFFKNKTGGDFNIIIDDGSHVPSYQLLSFEFLWPSIVPGGFYIIEDVQTSYLPQSGSVYGYKMKNEKSLVGHMKLVADAVNRKFAKGASPLSCLYSDISSIQFGQNIIIIRKEDTKKNMKGRCSDALKSGEGTKYEYKGLPFP